MQFRKGKHDREHNYKDLTRSAPTIDTAGGHIEIDGKRCTWPHETAKRLASFPAVFVFTGDLIRQQARIGNSVPPLFMRAIAAHVAGILEPHRA